MSLLKIEANSTSSLKSVLSYINDKLSESENILNANFDIPVSVVSKFSFVRKRGDKVKFYYDLKVYELDSEGEKKSLIFD